MFKKFIKLIRKSPFISSLSFVVMMWLLIPAIVYHYEKTASGANITSYWDGLWWGIVTLLTVGYGDRFPVTPEGRIWTGVMMIGGVAGIGVVTAKISSVFLERALRDRKGLVETESLDQHFVICGWKNEMHTLLLHILDSNPQITCEQIVLVNNVADSEIENLHEYANLKKIKHIRGDFFSADVLKRAAPEKAFKILILADATPGEKGAVPTRTEADARTIMAAMTLNNIAKGIPVVAEILDSQMDQYLKLAQVHEIIYSRDYSRLLLAMASTGLGVTNIFHDLLDPQSHFMLTTEPIPVEMINLTYNEFHKQFIDQHPRMNLLGILEHSGNSHKAKEQALRKAQHTPNVGELVKNLQSVKSIRFNFPLFNPDPEYIVGEDAMAIVIRKREDYANAT
ncbi:MAG: NAD-binding protein [Bdellovibrionales bacterium]|nr:NAD-binding protein [Bdellovibrionales bacterium]